MSTPPRRNPYRFPVVLALFAAGLTAAVAVWEGSNWWRWLVNCLLFIVAAAVLSNAGDDWDRGQK